MDRLIVAVMGVLFVAGPATAAKPVNVSITPDVAPGMRFVNGRF